VADYTRQVATALALRGERVHVWAPGHGGTGEEHGVLVHRLERGFSLAGLLEVGTGLGRWPGRLFVQYAPHALGMRGMNLPLALWVASRLEPVWALFHEVAFPFRAGQRLARHLLAASQRAMAALVARRASRIFVTTEAWTPLLARLAGSRIAPTWLPVPSNLPLPPKAADRRQLGLPEGTLVGHFGTYGEDVGGLLEKTLHALPKGAARVVLFGRGAPEFSKRFESAWVSAPSITDAAQLSAALSCCEVLLQPYPDGVTGRRSTVMAALASGAAVVSNLGPLSEPLWSTLPAPALAPSPAAPELAERVSTLLAHEAPRRALGASGAAIYQERFALGRTVDALLAAAEEERAAESSTSAPASVLASSAASTSRPRGGG
jgi:hypothetical protein